MSLVYVLTDTLDALFHDGPEGRHADSAAAVAIALNVVAVVVVVVAVVESKHVVHLLALPDDGVELEVFPGLATAEEAGDVALLLPSHAYPRSGKQC